jgi:di/tricarboxylate transporter
VVRVLYGLFWLTALAGLALLHRAVRPTRALLLIVPVLGVLASVAVFYGDTRYSLPLAPSLVIGAAFAISRLLDLARKRGGRAL